jgi:hypothetical protein
VTLGNLTKLAAEIRGVAPGLEPSEVTLGLDKNL